MDESERCKVVRYIRNGSFYAEGSSEEIKRYAGLQSKLRLRIDDPKVTASRLKELGFEVQIDGIELEVPLKSRSQMKQELVAADLKDLRLIEPTMDKAFQKLSEGRA